MIKREICVVNSKGLHARPATVFAETAAKYDGEVRVSYGKKEVTGKSLIALLSLMVPRDALVSLSVEGEEADAMMDKLAGVLGKNYE